MYPISMLYWTLNKQSAERFTVHNMYTNFFMTIARVIVIVIKLIGSGREWRPDDTIHISASSTERH